MIQYIQGLVQLLENVIFGDLCKRKHLGTKPVLVVFNQHKFTCSTWSKLEVLSVSVVQLF
jgi:hypothetical protein